MTTKFNHWRRNEPQGPPSPTQQAASNQQGWGYLHTTAQQTEVIPMHENGNVEDVLDEVFMMMNLIVDEGTDSLLDVVMVVVDHDENTRVDSPLANRM